MKKLYRPWGKEFRKNHPEDFKKCCGKIYYKKCECNLDVNCNTCNGSKTVPARSQDLQADFYDCPTCTESRPPGHKNEL